jgi:hypothetical protein
MVWINYSGFTKELIDSTYTLAGFERIPENLIYKMAIRLIRQVHKIIELRIPG